MPDTTVRTDLIKITENFISGLRKYSYHNPISFKMMADKTSAFLKENNISKYKVDEQDIKKFVRYLIKKVYTIGYLSSKGCYWASTAEEFEACLAEWRSKKQYVDHMLEELEAIERKLNSPDISIYDKKANNG